MVIMLSGEAILVDNNGRTVMRAGDVAAFPKDDGNGHVLVNESEADCCFVAVGRPASGDCHYPDIDMHLFAGNGYRRSEEHTSELQSLMRISYAVFCLRNKKIRTVKNMRGFRSMYATIRTNL